MNNLDEIIAELDRVIALADLSGTGYCVVQLDIVVKAIEILKRAYPNGDIGIRL